MATSLSNPFPNWGDAGSKPADSTQYDGGDRPYAQHFDYLWDQQDKFATNVINEFNTEVIRRDGSVSMNANLTVEGADATSSTTAQDSYHTVFDAAYWDSGTSTSVDVSANLYHSANSDSTSTVNLDVQGTSVLTAASGGTVSVLSGNLDINSNDLVGASSGSVRQSTTDPRLEIGAVGAEWTVYDGPNAQTVASFKEGGTTKFPNGSLIQGHDPQTSLTESTSPKSWDFSGGDDRDLHNSTDVTISNGSASSATETITVELYDGTDTTGTLLVSESQSITVASGASTTATFITTDQKLDNGTYHINITQSGTTLSVDSTTEHTRGAEYTLSQKTLGGDLALSNQYGTDLLTVNANGPIEIQNTNLDVNQNEVRQFVFGKRTSDPTGAVNGQAWYRSDLD